MRTRKTTSGKSWHAIWPDHPLPAGTTYAARRDWLLERGLGVWDVYAACEREGSLDSAIRKAEANDIAGLALPRLAAIAHNGGESFKHARHTEGSACRSTGCRHPAPRTHPGPSSASAMRGARCS